MPAAYTAQQKSAISEFTSVTQSDKTTAAKILRQHNWNVGGAINGGVPFCHNTVSGSDAPVLIWHFCDKRHALTFLLAPVQQQKSWLGVALQLDPSALANFEYFNNPNGAANPTRPALSKIFDKYRDNPSEEPDEMNIDGLTELLGEMDIEPGDMGALIFSEIVSSPSLGKVTREGFVDGWSELGVDNLPKMKDVCQQRRLTLSQDMALFKNVYNAAFPLVLPPGSKTLPLEFATEFWTMLFTPPGLEWKSAKGTPWLEWWLEFQQQIKTKAVNRDLWKQTLNFARETLKDDSLSFWSEESSWPSVIDEFVEWVKTEKRPGENGGSGEAMEVE
ncbi:DUF298-domain-containing protein [Hortaea werneckii]|nr:DUF298-domain-containing protein [Hortaea werneckii]KAI7094787.1 DUF298-domain-containing protein [Hortaea werneckii]KAI7232749.1 DUF298-domain-containing protein [Hortaea werneckii]KAI7314783.1 DUF298-domain-containing protein [Hortaea werneckii]KAI7375449.1 DUF298-domain-containing protein [Hortaea werneckii]